MMCHIKDCHRSLWPNQPALSDLRLAAPDCSERVRLRQPSFFPTSLVCSAILALFSMPQRGVPQRKKVWEFLRFVIEKCCSIGFTVKVALVDPHGTYVECDQTLTDPTAGTLFDPAMIPLVQFEWSSNQLSNQKPWVATPFTAPHVADWLCFCLDPVLVKQRRVNNVLLDAKTYLALSAKGVLTQLRSFWDNNWLQLTDETFRRVRSTAVKRLPPFQVRVLMGQAYSALVNGDELYFEFQ